MDDQRGVLIYGGAFNPVHIGHLRLAIEAAERLGALVSRVEFVPTANPPHKDDREFLPLRLRLEMLAVALEPLKNMTCSNREELRDGPSYTYDTLNTFQEEPQRRYFLLGHQDYELLPTWSRGLRLPETANLVVAPRGSFSAEDFVNLTRKMWSGAKREENYADLLIMLPPGGLKIFYLPIPVLEISATEIRSLWLAGKSIDYLVPEAVKTILVNERAAILNAWQES